MKKNGDQKPSRGDKASDKAIHYNENVQNYVRSGKVSAAAERAKRALENTREAAELRRAEKAGKRRAQSR